jgi:hypothetical protein
MSWLSDGATASENRPVLAPSSGLPRPQAASPCGARREHIRAVSAICRQRGEDAASDYIVDEKLMSYAEAAEDLLEFSQELCRLVAAIRDIFPPDTMRSGLKRLARYLEDDETDTAEMLREKQGASARRNSGQDATGGENDDDIEAMATLTNQMHLLAAKRKRFEFLCELLIADQLGTA